MPPKKDLSLHHVAEIPGQKQSQDPGQVQKKENIANILVLFFIFEIIYGPKAEIPI